MSATLTLFIGQTINLNKLYLEEVTFSGYEILGFADYYIYNSSSLEYIEMIDSTNYEVPNYSGTLRVVVEVV